MIEGMAVILTVWGGLALLFSGLGRLVTRVAAGGAPADWRPAELIWLGWGGLILVLQLWHLWRPVNGWALTFAVLLAMAGWLAQPLRKAEFTWHAAPAAGLSLGAAGLVYAFWLANRAGGDIAGVGDAGLYHVGMIRWLAEEPIVLGLANLHGRFGFNNAGFLYYALLEIGPLTRASFHFAGGFLLLIAGLQSLGAAVRILLPDSRTKIHEDAAHVNALARWMEAALLGFVIHLAFIYGASTSPDLMVTLLSLTIGTALFRLLFVTSAPARLREATNAHDVKAAGARALFFIAFLSAVGVTVKLSLLFFGALATVAALFAYRRIVVTSSASDEENGQSGILWRTTLAGGLVLLPWIGRNLLLSGYFVYPGVALSINVPWRVPAAQMVDEAAWIRSWARLPWVHYDTVLADWAWLQPWLHDAATWRVEVVLPLLLIGVGGLGLLAKRSVKVDGSSLALWLSVLLGALIPWFLTAPAIRFAGGLLWLAAAGGLALNLVDWPASRVRLAGVGFVVLALLIARYDAQRFGPLVPPGPGQWGLYPLPTVEVAPFTTTSGLTYGVPVSGYSCWAAPLPCSPYLMPTLTTLRPESLPEDWRSGFVQPEDSVQMEWPLRR